jgi:glutathione S-transferase
MLTLYHRPTCPFCQKVVAVGDALGADLNLRDVNEPGVADEVEQKGGKRQFPFLIDEERGVSMYESDDIIAYLHERFSANS